MFILETNICEKASFLATVLFFKKMVSIISIIVPIALVLLITIDIAKAVFASDDNQMKTAQKLAIRRIIIGLVVFFVPIVVNAVFSMFDGKEAAGITCYNNAEDGVVEALQEAENEKLLEYEEDIQKLIQAAKENKAKKDEELARLREIAKQNREKKEDDKPSESTNTSASAAVLQSVEKVGNGIDSRDFTYSNKSPLAKTYDQALSKKLYKTNCALAVCWMYKDAGIVSKNKTCFWFDKTNIHHKGTLTSEGKVEISYPDRKTVKSLVSSGQLTPGDAVGTCDYRHTTIYKGQNSKGKYMFADGGHNAVRNKTVSGHTMSGGKKICILAHLK